MMVFKFILFGMKLFFIFSKEILKFVFEYLLMCVLIKLFIYYPQFIIADSLNLNPFTLSLNFGFLEFFWNWSSVWGWWVLLIITAIDEKSVFNFFTAKLPSLFLLLINFICLSILFIKSNMDWEVVTKTFAFIPYFNIASIVIFMISFIISLRATKARGDGQDSLNIMDQIFHFNLDVAYDAAKNQKEVTETASDFE